VLVHDRFHDCSDAFEVCGDLQERNVDVSSMVRSFATKSKRRTHWVVVGSKPEEELKAPSEARMQSVSPERALVDNPTTRTMWIPVY
jgi:hypothetical protein